MASPAQDMAAFEKDKSIKQFAGDHQARIKAWRAGGFFKPLESHEINLVQRLTKVADELLQLWPVNSPEPAMQPMMKSPFG